MEVKHLPDVEGTRSSIMIKTAYIIGMHKAFVEYGLLSDRTPFHKIAAAADIAAQANPGEVQAVGEYITQADLDSMGKILEVLSMLLQQYQQQAGGMPPQAGGMPPEMMGGMPPQAGGMPQQPM